MSNLLDRIIILEDKINKYYYNDNLRYPLNYNYNGGLCLSNINKDMLNFAISYYDDRKGYMPLYDVINDNNLDIEYDIKSDSKYINIHRIDYKLLTYNCNGRLNDVINTKLFKLDNDFRKINISELYYYKVYKLDNLPYDINRLVFIECDIKEIKCDILKELNKLKIIEFYFCELKYDDIKNIFNVWDGKIKIFCCKIDNIYKLNNNDKINNYLTRDNYCNNKSSLC